MKNVRITIYKVLVDNDIDKRTFKRTDATLDQNSERSQNAVAADSKEELDGSLIARYRDTRDARIRQRLRFCLKKPDTEVLEYTNIIKTDPTYVYELTVGDDFTANDLQSIGTRIHDYLVRGTLYDWYLNAGLQPLDTDDSLEELEDSISSSLRGKSYGRKPMQPWGPATYRYEVEPLRDFERRDERRED